MGIAHLFTDPFYAGSAVSGGVPWTHPVSLAGRGYIIDETRYQRRFIPSTRQSFDSSAQPGEQTLNPEGLWPRSVSDWSLGSGQLLYDAEDSNRRMFRSSKGIDIWTRREFSLLPDTTEVIDTTEVNLHLAGFHDGTTPHLYVADGTSIKWTADAASYSFTTMTGSPAASLTQNAWTSDGATVYFAYQGSGVYSAAIGASAMASFSTYNADIIEYANGRLFAAADDDLSELNSAGTATTVLDHANNAFRWKAITGAPNGVYAGGNVGGQATVYYIGVNSTTGALLTPVVAMELPRGETLNQLYQYGGVLFIGTSLGFRVATIRSDNGLVYGPLVDAPGAVTTFTAEGQYVWFNWTNYDNVSTGLGRLSLEEFTETLVPAYASDLMATSQGAVVGVARYRDKTWLSVSGDGVYEQSADLVATGTLRLGNLDYGTSVRKTAVGLTFFCEPLKGTVSGTLHAQNGTDRAISPYSTTNGTGPNEPLDLGNIVSPSFDITLTLARFATDTTLGPTIKRFTLMSLPAPRRTEEILVPILLFRQVRWSGVEYHYDTLVEFDYLRALARSRQVVRYQEGATSYDVYIDDVQIEPKGWGDEYSWFQGTCFVRLVTVEA